MPAPGFFDRVYAAVGDIPAGRVTSYGEIARHVTGRAAAARTVGWALNALPADRAETVPWWRVINSRGRIGLSAATHAAAEQRARLAAEGVEVDEAGRVDLARFGWFDADGQR